ncbi:MAG: MerR family transcriptional regulator [Gammaproteobacteria bacterium]|nr:MAG: MerR family transcriptional regulator [Gammaproteobacteria bacterium]
MNKTYSISDLSKEFHITSRTIRHYEDLGLLSPVRKGTQRLFNAGDHVRLSLILRGKRIGFSLNEIREIITLYDQPEGEEQQTSFLLDKVYERRQKLILQRQDIQKMLSELDDIEEKLNK